MWKQSAGRWRRVAISSVLERNYMAVPVPVPVPAPAPADKVLKVTRNHIAYVETDAPKEAPKPRQLLSLPPFPSRPLHRPASSSSVGRVTAVSWIKYYFHHKTHYPVIQSLFTKGLVLMERPNKLRRESSLLSGSGSEAPAATTVKIKPNEVHRLDRESSGIILMGRTKESVSHLQWLFSGMNKAKTSFKAWNDACEATCQGYWALVIGSPEEKEGFVSAPLSKVLLNDGKTERVILARPSGFEASQEAVTEYRVLGPTINGCTWVELRPRTSRKHQLRVHCAEALGTPIVGDYKYGWFMHQKWKQMPRVDIEPVSGKPYKLRRPEGLDVQKGSVLSKVPLLHLHSRELVLPNISKFLGLMDQKSGHQNHDSALCSMPDTLRLVAQMPSHMKISWNLMSSYLV